MTTTQGDGRAAEVPTGATAAGAAGPPTAGTVVDPSVDPAVEPSVQPVWSADDVPNHPPAALGAPAAAPGAPEEPLPAALDGRPRRSWREQVRLGAAEMARLAAWMGGRAQPSTSTRGPLADADCDAAIRDLLATADDAARGVSVWPAARRARMERAFAALDAAETMLLRRAPEFYLRGRESAMRAHVIAHLPPEHPQRVEVERMRLASLGTPLGDVQREVLASANRTASRAARREHVRLRSFGTVVATTTVALFVLAVAIAGVSAARPDWMPLCFAPAGADAVVCPTGSSTLVAGSAASDAPPSVTEVDEAIRGTAAGPDAALVMLLGLAAAAVTGTAALRRMRGTSTPYAVPVALLALKLPTGALTAFLGLLLIHGQIVPGLSALDSSGQILAWAVLFGAAQQFVTGLVDKKAQSVLDAVGPAPMTAERE